MYPSNPVVIDLETSIHNTGEDAVGDMAASPFHPDNKVVWYGALDDSGSMEVYENKVSAPYYGDNWFVVGHNIKFDLLYLYRYSEWRTWSYTGKVWDTMIVEYLLTAQQSKYASLDDLSEKYGGTVKDSKIKEYWKAGISTEDIPEDEIVPYLKGDLSNTMLVYEKQREKAEQLGLMPLIESQMEALMAVVEMEFNGMYLDEVRLAEQANELMEDYKKLRDNITGAMDAYGIEDPNPNSNDHLSLLFFGGAQTVVRDLPILDDDGNEVRYKGGKRKGEVKTKKTEVKKSIRGFQLPPAEEWKAKKVGYFKTNDEVLKNIAKNNKYEAIRNSAKRVLEFRKISKDLNTYYKGLADLRWPTDGCIHGQLNQCATDTGRLSSSKPNMQNMSN